MSKALAVARVCFEEAFDESQLFAVLLGAFGLHELVEDPLAVLPDRIGFRVSPQRFQRQIEIVFQKVLHLSARFKGSGQTAVLLRGSLQASQ